MEGNALCVFRVQWIADVIKYSNQFQEHNFSVKVEEYKRNGFNSLCVLYYWTNENNSQIIIEI